MSKAQPNFEWIVAAHPTSTPADREEQSVLWLSLPQVEASGLDFVKWYELTLPAIVRKYRPDVLFSQTNYLPRRRLACGTLLLVQNAGYFSDEFDRLVMDSLQSRLARFLWRRKIDWARRSAAAATLVTVQTAALANCISALTGVSRAKIAVIPHGPGNTEHRYSLRCKTATTGLIRIGYVTKWGVQKNFQTLFRAARKLRDEGYAFRLILTLEKDTRETANVMASAKDIGVEALIDNYGEVPADSIAAIYDSLDIFVWPSFCESFGFPIVEAMARGIPVVVAKTNEGVEVTRGAAREFAPFDADALAHQLATLMDNPTERAKWAELSLITSQTFSWERSARETIAALKSIG